MIRSSKNLNTNRVEEKIVSTQQDQSTDREASTRVGLRLERKYYTRAAKKLQEEICETKCSCTWEEEAAKKYQRDQEDILKTKHSSPEKEAKLYVLYKKTFPNFKRRMIESYGEVFFYNGGSWHGEMSTRYRHYHIRKSMRFLQENMKSDDEWKANLTSCK